MSEEHVLEAPAASAGVCPCCGSSSYELDEYDPEDDWYYYICTCNNCGAFFTDWYFMTYREQTYETPDEQARDREQTRQANLNSESNKNEINKAISYLNGLGGRVSNQQYKIMIDRFNDTTDKQFYDNWGRFSSWTAKTQLESMFLPQGYVIDSETGCVKPANTSFY